MPHDTWKTSLEAREEALRNRHMKASEYWTEHTKKLPPLVVGDHVRIQNQIGQNPLKWDKTGKVIEVKQYDQYAVRVDGSGRITLRNRKFLRKFIPVQQDHPCISITTDQFLLNKCNTQNQENAFNQDPVHYKINAPEFEPPTTEQEWTETPVVTRGSAQAPNLTELHDQDFQSPSKSEEKSSQAIYHHNGNSRKSKRTTKAPKWMEDYII